MQKINIKDLTKVYNAGNGLNMSWQEATEYVTEKKYNRYSLNIEPPYQRGLCWTEEQKVAYVEYRLKGGVNGRHIYLNCPNYRSSNIGNDDWSRTFEVVDGKQRLTAVAEFMQDKIKVFGGYVASELDMYDTDADFIFVIENYKNKKEVVEWYLSMNTGGTNHTPADIKIATEYMSSL